MPDGFAGMERWRKLGRLLPRDVRERIFDPAFADLTRAWLTSKERPKRLPFGVHVVGTWAGCFSITIPRLFVQHGRLTRFGRLSLWTVGFLATIVLLLMNLARTYAS